MLILLFEKHLLWSRSDGPRRTIYFYYDDQTTWIVATVAVIWIAFLLIRRYRLSSDQRRSSRDNGRRVPKRVVRIKEELSLKHLAGGFSNNLHGIGIGLDADGEYCIHYFVGNATEELWPGAGITRLDASYRGVSLVVVQMPRAIAAESVDPEKLRKKLDVIVGGASGANEKLEGHRGTLGYFCKLKDKSTPCLLSNAHVLVDLEETNPQRGDWIVHPSPIGSPKSDKVAMLNPQKKKPLILQKEVDKSFEKKASANFIDAAIASLTTEKFQAVIPGIGTIKEHVSQKKLKVGDPVQKVGQTTGCTEGAITHVRVNLWIGYNNDSLYAYFKDQIVIESNEKNTAFADAGDSGSLVVGMDNKKAIGLLCAIETKDPTEKDRKPKTDAKIINNFGIASPIDKILKEFKIELFEDPQSVN